MSQHLELTMRPIGRVVRGRPQGAQGDNWLEQRAEIEIDPAWAEALGGLEGFSHIWILWWPDNFQGPPRSLQVHPEGRAETPLTGLFATRSPRRPNPIALTAVRLVERRGERLHVEGLDAFEGTPVLDIKPYLERGDYIPETTIPAWLEQLWQSHDKKHDS